MIAVKEFFDPATYTLTYIVYNPEKHDAIIIDPVWNYEPQGSRIEVHSFNLLKSYIIEKKLNILAVLETHVHADHISAAQVIKKEFPQSQICISEQIKEVQKTFAPIFNLGEGFKADGSQFDRLIKSDEILEFGAIHVHACSTPGHTSACMTYHIGHYLFTGDCLFMPDYGTGRCDFPGGDAGHLFESIQKLYEMADDLTVCTGHDYQPGGRPVEWHCPLIEQKRSNIQLNEHTTLEEFVKFREARDQGLKAPKLFFPGLLVNMMAGHLPAAESNGKSYLKIPINQ
jgi:glyoxylase-like metal-dependent hydrolase (beta-lactamase superfamily II)